MCVEQEACYFAKNSNLLYTSLKINIEETAREYYKTHLYEQENDIFNVKQMKPCDKDCFKQALTLIAGVYERSMNEEIQDLVKIIDAKAASLKTFGGQKDNGLKLVSHYQVYSSIDTIEDEVLDQIM